MKAYERVRKNLFGGGARKLGEILLARGAVTAGQLEQCLDFQKEDGRPLGKILLEKGFIELEEFLVALEEQDRSECDEPGPGYRIGKYELVREIARGGMGIVYEAEDPDLRRRVALKILKDENSAFIARLHREAAIAAQLRHPNIVAIHEVAHVRDSAGRSVHYIAMDYIEGRTLAEVLPEADSVELLRIMVDVGRAVAHAHSKGVIHRDLKPANVLIASNGRVLLTDFGLARAEDFKTQLTRTQAIIGTPHYMAPEQVQGRTKEIDPRTDVYALGVMLYEVLAGRSPFRGNTPANLFAQILNSDPPRPRSVRKSVASDLDVICMKAMEKSPARRYPTASGLVDDLERFRRGEAIEARPPGLFYRWSRSLGRRKPLAATAFVSLVIIFGLVMLLVPEKQKTAELREQILQQLRTRSGELLSAALDLRRAGDLEGMRKFAGKMEEATAEAIREMPELAEPHYLRGRMLRALLRDREALAAQEKALALEPDHAGALFEHVVHLSRKYRIRRAELLAGEWRGQPMSDHDPSLTRLRGQIRADLKRLGMQGPATLATARGYSAWVDGDRKGAVHWFTAALEKDPTRTDAYEALALLASDEREFQKAIDWFTRGLENDAGHVPFLEGRARAWFDLGAGSREPLEFYRRSMEDCDRALRLAGERPVAWYHRATTQIHWADRTSKTGGESRPMLRRARDDLDEAIRIDPGTAAYFDARARVSLHLAIEGVERGENVDELFSSAEKDYDAAIRLNVDRVDSWSSLGILHLNRGAAIARNGGDPNPQYAEAVRLLSEGLEHHPTDVELRMRRATVHSNLGMLGKPKHFEESLADLTEILQQNVNHQPALSLRGFVRAQQGLARMMKDRDPAPTFRLALSDLTRAVDLNRGDASAWRRRGLLKTMLAHYGRRTGGDPTVGLRSSIADLDEALAIDARFVQAWIDRGRAYQMLKEYGKALGSYEKAVAINPSVRGSLEGPMKLCRDRRGE